MGVPPIIVTFMRLTPFWSKSKAVAHTLPYDWAVLGSTMAGKPLAPEEWAGVTTPTLVMAGEKSPAQLQKAAQALVAVLPNARLHLLAGQSHNPSMKAVAPPVSAFFVNSAERGSE
jgi:pimeloyl-ACP methyl ester carboxylesterase